MPDEPQNIRIASAADASLSNPAAGETLVYHAPTATWRNQALTKAQVGLTDVDNTSDAAKVASGPIATTLQSKVSGSGVTAMIALSQAAYDALVTKDPTTLYVITS